MCVREYVCVCVLVCACVHVSAGEYVCVRACVTEYERRLYHLSFVDLHMFASDTERARERKRYRARENT